MTFGHVTPLASVCHMASQALVPVSHDTNDTKEIHKGNVTMENRVVFKYLGIFLYIILYMAL